VKVLLKELRLQPDLSLEVRVYLKALGLYFAILLSCLYSKAGVTAGGHNPISHPDWESEPKLGIGMFFSGDSLLQVHSRAII